MPLLYSAASAGTLKFAFNGDLFAYLNGQLLVNLGGVHALETQTVDLTTVRPLSPMKARVAACARFAHRIHMLAGTCLLRRESLLRPRR